MATINFGVIDQPYAFSSSPKPSRKKGKRGKTKGKRAPKDDTTTTGDVAEILEEKYGVMQFFFDRYEAEIGKEFEESIGGALESLLMGAPVSPAPFASACSAVEEMFRKFLETKQMDGQVEGVPTQASLLGISQRFKNRKGKAGRPSFIDTSLYENSFKVWVDNT